MRTKSIIFFILATMLSAMPVSAQFGRIVESLGQLGKKKEQTQTNQQTNQQMSQAAKIYYVSVNGKFRTATGQNMQGSETRRVSMYGNRYNFDKALRLFGAKNGYGAQKP